jgi:hypothetical protein
MLRLYWCHTRRKNSNTYAEPWLGGPFLALVTPETTSALGSGKTTRLDQAAEIGRNQAKSMAGKNDPINN